MKKTVFQCMYSPALAFALCAYMPACALQSDESDRAPLETSVPSTISYVQRSTPDGSQIAPGMGLVGFDADVARANGYEIVTLPDGSQASVPSDKAQAARSGEYVPTSGIVKVAREGDGASTQFYSELPGDCGRSYVALWATGNSKATLHTGFFLVPNAGNVWDVNWNVNIHDNGGNSTQHYEEGDGGNNGNSWIGWTRLLSLTRGWADATVIWYSSYTITTRGWVCWSAGPSTGANIY